MTKLSPKAAPKMAPAPPDDYEAFEVPATPSPGTASPDIIEETDIEALNDHDVLRRLIQSKLAKVRDAQPDPRLTANTAS